MKRSGVMKSTGRSTFWLGIGLVLAMVAAGCSSSDDTAQPTSTQPTSTQATTSTQPTSTTAADVTTTTEGEPEEKVLRIAMTEAAPDPFDPPLVFSSASISIVQNVFDGLTEAGADLKMGPGLAESWTISEDGLTYTFQIRQDVTFQNGKPLTAADVAFSLVRSLDPEVASPISFYLANVEGAFSEEPVSIQALDDSTLEIKLSQPTGAFLAILSRPCCWAVDQDVIETHGDDWVNPPNVVGTGAYTLVSRTGNTEFVYEANPDYFLGPPNIDRIEISVVQESTAAVARYQAGEFDVVVGLSAASIINALGDDELSGQLSTKPVLRTNWLGMRNDIPPFDDRNVRLAFAHAIDKDAVVQTGLGGGGAPGKGWIPEGLPGNINDEFAGYEFDPNLARELLVTAGYPDGNGFPSLDLHFSSEMAGMSEVAFELIQAQLRQNLNIEIGLRNMPRVALTTLMQDQEQRPPLFAWTFGADIFDAATLTEFLGLTGAFFNFENYSNPDYDDIIRRALGTADESERAEFYRESERIHAEDVPNIPLFYPHTAWLAKPDVVNFDFVGANLGKFREYDKQ